MDLLSIQAPPKAKPYPPSHREDKQFREGIVGRERRGSVMMPAGRLDLDLGVWMCGVLYV